MESKGLTKDVYSAIFEHLAKIQGRLLSGLYEMPFSTCFYHFISTRIIINISIML